MRALSILILLLSLVLCRSVMAQGYLESDDTRARAKDQAGSQGFDGSGSLAGNRLLRPSGNHKFVICNRSEDNMLSVAYTKLENEEWRIVGWRNVRQKECQTIVENISYTEFFAFSHARTWSGVNPECVHLQERFNVAADLDTCPRGFEKVQFRIIEVDILDRDRDGVYSLNLRD